MRKFGAELDRLIQETKEVSADPNVSLEQLVEVIDFRSKAGLDHNAPKELQVFFQILKDNAVFQELRFFDTQQQSALIDHLLHLVDTAPLAKIVSFFTNKVYCQDGAKYIRDGYNAGMEESPVFYVDYDNEYDNDLIVSVNFVTPENGIVDLDSRISSLEEDPDLALNGLESLFKSREDLIEFYKMCDPYGVSWEVKEDAVHYPLRDWVKLLWNRTSDIQLVLEFLIYTAY